MMERLSEKRDGQNVIPLRQDGANKWALCSAGMGEAPAQYLYGDHADRLAAYEETGLEPEEISARRKLPPVVDAALEAMANHIRDLLQAEREARLVVLPCKVGDTVYGVGKLKKLDGSIVYEMKHGKVLCHKILPSGIFCVVSAEEQYGYPASWKFEEFGQTWFLTREEAEAALVPDTNVGNTEGGST